jgi:tryptophanyl-tRNA synthetase
MSVTTGESIAEIEARYDGQGYGAFKQEVAESVVTLLEPFRQRFHELRGDADELQRILALGANKASEASAPTLASMYDRMGFVR